MWGLLLEQGILNMSAAYIADLRMGADLFTHRGRYSHFSHEVFQALGVGVSSDRGFEIIITIGAARGAIERSKTGGQVGQFMRRTSPDTRDELERHGGPAMALL